MRRFSSPRVFSADPARSGGEQVRVDGADALVDRQPALADRRDREEQGLGDLLVGLPPQRPLKHLLLARAGRRSGAGGG